MQIKHKNGEQDNVHCKKFKTKKPKSTNSLSELLNYRKVWGEHEDTDARGMFQFKLK